MVSAIAAQSAASGTAVMTSCMTPRFVLGRANALRRSAQLWGRSRRLVGPGFGAMAFFHFKQGGRVGRPPDDKQRRARKHLRPAEPIRKVIQLSVYRLSSVALVLYGDEWIDLNIGTTAFRFAQAPAGTTGSSC